MSGEKTVQAALDSLCEEKDAVMARIERSRVQGDLGPLLNKERDISYWLNQPGSPKAKLANEDEKPITVPYDELIKSWQN